MGVAEVLFLILLVVKLLKIAALSWLAVFSPLIVSFCVILILLGLGYFVQ